MTSSSSPKQNKNQCCLKKINASSVDRTQGLQIFRMHKTGFEPAHSYE
ncbi:hypothetical protein JL09_g6620 [Pichia kudriavzevii]|uniref:Uncharacterized protein n=1 Tax=Pichia kudriavzevii TaxID=4909 RepID=A0A099NN31_PICKU|nr:hypothetical protein JL09_g6620 [Pichia kudriavzevii]